MKFQILSLICVEYGTFDQVPYSVHQKNCVEYRSECWNIKIEQVTVDSYHSSFIHLILFREIFLKWKQAKKTFQLKKFLENPIPKFGSISENSFINPVILLLTKNTLTKYFVFIVLRMPQKRGQNLKGKKNVPYSEHKKN